MFSKAELLLRGLRLWFAKCVRLRLAHAVTRCYCGVRVQYSCASVDAGAGKKLIC